MDEFAASYQRLCITALALPFDEGEQAMAARVVGAVEQCLDVEPHAAAHQARRWVLFRRIRLLHEQLILSWPPERLSLLLDQVGIVGPEHLRELASEGGLLVSLHYGLYSSILWLWLARAAARGTLKQLILLYFSAPGLSPGAIASRLPTALIKPSTITLLDLRSIGRAEAARRLLSELRSGGVALVLPDALAAGGPSARRLALTVGRGSFEVPSGVAWMARRVECPIAPVFLRPDGDAHTLVFGPPRLPSRSQDVVLMAQSVLQNLLDQTVLVEPSAWANWPDLAKEPAVVAPSQCLGAQTSHDPRTDPSG